MKDKCSANKFQASPITKMSLKLLIFAALVYVAHGLDNGLAKTPPMGWLSWERFTCNVDCDNEPENCISERLYKEMADRLVSDGYKELGYQYVNIDDCWMEKNRDSNGKLVPHKKRFPNGIKGLADYIHSKGLKLGIYQDVGTNTCAGYPGSLGHFIQDAQTFAEWEIDMLKVDGCYADVLKMNETYPDFSNAISKVKRDILFSCEWPFYEVAGDVKPNYTAVAKYCNIWRNYHDIDDSWNNVLSIVDYYAKNKDEFASAAGPGAWHDPDMILAGNFGLSYDEARAQFMLWSVLASPLLMSNDLRYMETKYKDLLQNKEIIAVNQDSLGIMGKQIQKNGNVEIWARPIAPKDKNGVKTSQALVFFNRNTLGNAQNITVELTSVGLDSTKCYTVYDVFSPTKQLNLCPGDKLTTRVNPSGANMIIAKLK